MNTRLALYVAGSAYLARTIYLKAGRRVVVLDRTRRRRIAAHAMRAAGLPTHRISAALGIRRERMEKVLAFAWRF